MDEHTLSTEECKQYLGDTAMTDEQIDALRDELCVLIDKIIDSYFEKKLQ